MGDMFFRRFQIQEIREGGMGTVNIARDHSVDPTHTESKFLQETGLFHTCAVKTFQDRFFDTLAVVERFVREAASWVELPRHERVVFAHYINIIEGRPYIFLEYVEGPSLRQWINHSRHTPAEPAAVALQMCEGMTYSPETGKLVHRDLKPDNVPMVG
jgi:serine/threonine protein kinase